MPRKVKIHALRSRNYELLIENKEPLLWFVRDVETCADTNNSSSYDDYRILKRTWRRSKEDFESACRFMEFNNLFSNAGIKL